MRAVFLSAGAGLSFPAPTGIVHAKINENTHIFFQLLVSAAPEIWLATCEISRTQRFPIPGYGRNLKKLRDSGVTARKISVIFNQGFEKQLPRERHRETAET
jgi:hypothetical protein